MKSKAGKKVFIITLTVAFFVTVAYIALAFYYMDGFSYGTWANGQYCTGKSVQVINKELLDNFHYSEVLVVFYDGDEKKQETLILEESAVQADYTASLNQLLVEQNPFFWGENLISFGNHGKNRQIPVEIKIDETSFKESFYQLDFVKQAIDKTIGIRIIKTEQGYQLVDTLANVLDVELAYQYVTEAVRNKEAVIDLTLLDCYQDLEPDSVMSETLRIWKQIEKFQNCDIIYDMGDEQVSINSAVVCDWIATAPDGSFLLDENGSIVMREEAITEFIHELAAEFNTYNIPREFQSTSGRVVNIEGGNYGNEIDCEEEIAYLTEAFSQKKQEVRIPVYLHEGSVRGKNDLGDTFIEIDLTEQIMYCHKDGELFCKTPIVTGNMARRYDTPATVCYVYGKQKNRTLRGANYAAFVHFWMPVKGNIGIHDATWRKEFGGDIYLNDGSHGCINTPREAMEEIYNQYEIGTPVVMYY